MYDAFFIGSGRYGEEDCYEVGTTLPAGRVLLPQLSPSPVMDSSFGCSFRWVGTHREHPITRWSLLHMRFA